MSYYMRVVPELNITRWELWKIDGDTAFRLGIANPERSVGCYFKAEAGETIWDAIRRLTPWFQPNGVNPFQKTELEPGQYYPRMARPSDQHVNESPGRNPGEQIDLDSIAVAHGQLNALTEQLDRICQTVHPTDKTFYTFGHDIRNLLILACTEVESHWRGILVANGVTKKIFKTEHYVELCKPMHLDEYAVVFPNYPWIKPVKPFEIWDKAAPTKSLKWYNAYNAVKHDRENEFEQATLFSAFEAVSACAVMMAAQYGLHSENARHSSLKSFFGFASVPSWSITEIYSFPYGMAAGAVMWSPVLFPF